MLNTHSSWGQLCVICASSSSPSYSSSYSSSRGCTYSSPPSASADLFDYTRFLWFVLLLSFFPLLSFVSFRLRNDFRLFDAIFIFYFSLPPFFLSLLVSFSAYLHFFFISHFYSFPFQSLLYRFPPSPTFSLVIEHYPYIILFLHTY